MVYTWYDDRWKNWHIEVNLDYATKEDHDKLDEIMIRDYGLTKEDEHLYLNSKDGLCITHYYYTDRPVEENLLEKGSTIKVTIDKGCFTNEYPLTAENLWRSYTGKKRNSWVKLVNDIESLNVPYDCCGELAQLEDSNAINPLWGALDSMQVWLPTTFGRNWRSGRYTDWQDNDEIDTTYPNKTYSYRKWYPKESQLSSTDNVTVGELLEVAFKNINAIEDNSKYFSRAKKVLNKYGYNLEVEEVPCTTQPSYTLSIIKPTNESYKNKKRFNRHIK